METYSIIEENAVILSLLGFANHSDHFINKNVNIINSKLLEFRFKTYLNRLNLIQILNNTCNSLNITIQLRHERSRYFLGPTNEISYHQNLHLISEGYILALYSHNVQIIKQDP